MNASLSKLLTGAAYSAKRKGKMNLMALCLYSKFNKLYTGYVCGFFLDSFDFLSIRHIDSLNHSCTDYKF